MSSAIATRQHALFSHVLGMELAPPAAVSERDDPIHGRQPAEHRAHDARDTALTELVEELRQRAEHPAPVRRRPRLGFVGVEWSRHSRLRDIADSGLADIRCITDSDPDVARDAAAQVRNLAPNVRVLPEFEHLLAEPLDGIVLGGAREQHAAHALAAMDRGMAVFCQHPLADSARDTELVVARARERDRLLGVDYQYRDVSGVSEMAALVRDGAVGEVFSIDLRHHSAFGPETPGDGAHHGCLLELGSHLVDLLLHVLDAPVLRRVSGLRHASGRLLEASQAGIAEDHATAELLLNESTSARIACSWRAALGQEAQIEATFVGTRGTLRLRNVAGTLNAFRVEHCEGARCRTLGGTLDAWGGRGAGAWVRQLARSPAFDPASERISQVATIIEQIVRNSDSRSPAFIAAPVGGRGEVT